MNRAATFLDAEDKRFYHELLVEPVAFERLSVHAYALMSYHVHLMISTTNAGDLARAIRMLNQRYVASFNRRHRRTGTLWESRFRSCLVDSDHYLLKLYRYIELNLVRAAMVDAPEPYAWSSARANLGPRFDHCIVPHPIYLALGSTAAERATAYRGWLQLTVAEEDLAAIRLHIQQERALGSPRFQAMVARTLNCPVAVRTRGRTRATVLKDSNE